MSEITEQDQLLLVNSLLPQEIGQLFKQKVTYTSLNALGSILAVGSEQGYLWIVDMLTRKVIKEITEARTAVKVLRLHQEHPFIASGSVDGLVAIINYNKPSVKQVSRERDQHCVCSMEWSLEGDQLFVGYSSGKLLSFCFHIDKMSIQTTPLYEFSSEIVQLSQFKELLLVSTLDKPVVLDIKTGQTTQVGSRERKPGSYGGSFTKLSGDVVIARPGLRLWIADKDGKVKSTAKFKDAFNSQTLPSIPLYGGITTHTSLSDAWQFGQILPWMDSWIVSWHGNTVWVLEPHTLSCIGVMTLGQKIIDVGTEGRNIYLLLCGHQRPVVKLSLPRQVKEKMKWGIDALVENVDTDNAKNKEHVKIKEDVKNQEGVEVEDVKNQECVEVEDVKNQECVEVEDVKSKEHVEVETAKMEVVEMEEIKMQDTIEDVIEHLKPQTVSTEVSHIDTLVEDEELITTGSGISLDTNLTDTKELTNAHSDNVTLQEIPSFIITHDKEKTREEEESKKHKQDQGSKNVLKVMESGFADLKGKLSQPLGILSAGRKQEKETSYDDKEPETEKDQTIPSIPLSPVEINRRVKMMEVNDDDDIAVRASKKTRKTKGKGHRKRKHTPTSSTHSSLERLANIDDDDVIDSTQTTPSLEHKVYIEDDNDMSSISCPLLIQQNETSKDQPNSIQNLLTNLVQDEPDPANPDLENQPVLQEPVDEQDEETKQVLDEKKEIVSVSTEHEDISVIVLKKEQNLKYKPLFDDDPLFDTETVPVDGNILASEPMSVMTTPPTGIRGRARAFLGDYEDLTLHPDGEQEPLFHDNDPVPTSVAPHTTTTELLQENNNIGIPLTTSERTNSLSVCSSNSLEEIPNHPLLSGSCSESDDEGGAAVKVHKHESIYAPDYYSLVDKLVGESRQTEHPSPSFAPCRRDRADAHLHDVISDQATEAPNYRTSTSDILEAHSVDIWCPVPFPNHVSIQSLCLSKSSLWLINQKQAVFWSSPSNRGRDWQALKKHMSQISSSSHGKIVWGVHHHQAYVRHGISDLNPAGSVWWNVTHNSPISRRVKWVACDNSKVWAITTDNKVMFRKGVTEGKPEGKVWVEVKPSNAFVQIACCHDIVWALDASGNVVVREEITPSNPSGKTWKDIKSPTFAAISVVDTGIVWGIDLSNRLWFRCGATVIEPGGGGPWWEVAISTINKTASSPTDSSWKVMSVERSNSFLQSVSSFISSAVHNRLLALSACAQSGVCLLTSDNQLHACWQVASGYHYELACNDGVFNLSIWIQVTAGNSKPWVVRDDKELFCILSSDRVEQVECKSYVNALASSPSALWVICGNEIWSRQGICATTPQGISWDYIELGSHMYESNLVQLAIGRRVAWAVDNLGQIHFRFGIHPREPGTGMAPAWIPVDPGTSYVFTTVVVSADDWLVWAIDQHNIPYVRKEVTADYPVGRSWEVVLGRQVRQLSAACSKVFALSSSGEVFCRHGITETNPAGNYWRRLPGIFDHLAANPIGELWLIDDRGNVKKQRSKVVSICQETKQKEKDELELSMAIEEWEVL